MSQDNFIFVDLATVKSDKAFGGFAAGDFVDMFGREISIKKKDLQTFIENTRKRIADFQAKGMPGLPIDGKSHDKGDAAGWITGVEDEVAEVETSDGKTVPILRLLAEWTKIGVDLISEKVQANFSPTVDMEGKVIMGGSLTNWPASVDANGVPLFEAIELSQGVTALQATTPEPTEQPESAAEEIEQTVESSPEPETEDTSINGDDPEIKHMGANRMTVEMTQEELDALVEKRVNQALQEQAESVNDGQKVELSQLVEAFGINTENAENQAIKHLDQLAELVEQQANLKWQAKLAEMQRQNRYAELAARVTGSSPEAPRGIPMDADTIKAELMKLSPEQATFWGGLLESTVKGGLVEFSELGHGKQQKGVQPVPEYAVDSLKAAIDNGASVKEFFELAGLGNPEDYDLSAFEGDK